MGRSIRYLDPVLEVLFDNSNNCSKSLTGNAVDDKDVPVKFELTVDDNNGPSALLLLLLFVLIPGREVETRKFVDTLPLAVVLLTMDDNPVPIPNNMLFEVIVDDDGNSILLLLPNKDAFERITEGFDAKGGKEVIPLSDGTDVRRIPAAPPVDVETLVTVCWADILVRGINGDDSK